MVKKNWLIVINDLLWMVAGMNIANIGVKSILAIDSLVWLLCVPVFAVFATMFFRIISKNCERILSMEGEKAKIYKFLTLKGYLIIAFMMTMGITLRRLGTIPEHFFAFFYTGLGSALFIAGLWPIISMVQKCIYEE